MAVHVTALDASTTLSPEQMRDDIFFDDVNLLTQFNACSYGMTNMKPYHKVTEGGNHIQRGVAEVAIDTTISGKHFIQIENTVLAAFRNKFGSTNQFDHIILCMVSTFASIWLSILCKIISQNLSS